MLFKIGIIVLWLGMCEIESDILIFMLLNWNCIWDLLFLKDYFFMENYRLLWVDFSSCYGVSNGWI